MALRVLTSSVLCFICCCLLTAKGAKMSNGPQRAPLMDRDILQNLPQTLKDLDKQKFGCLRITEPKEDTQNRYKCFMQTFFETVYQPIFNSSFPNFNRTSLSNFLINMTVCEYEAAGVKFNESTLNIPSYIESYNSPEWAGSREDLEAAEEVMRDCIANITDIDSNAVDMMLDINYCEVESVIELCSETGRDVGVILPIVKSFLTLADDSFCDEVRLPDKMKTAMTTCIDTAKRSMMNTGKYPLRMTQRPTSIRQRMPFNQLGDFLQTFLKDVLFGSIKCLGEQLKSEIGTELDSTSVVNYVKSFDGWNTTDRDLVVEAMLNCSEGLKPIRGGERKSPTEMWDYFTKYAQCFAPQFADICGLNNEVSEFFHPFLSPDYISGVLKALMELGGEPLSELVTSLKEKKLPQIQ